jgi:hypothetical protein
MRGAARPVALLALLVLAMLAVAAARQTAAALAIDGLPPGVPVPAWAKGEKVHFDPAEPQNPRLAGGEPAALDAGRSPSDARTSPAALSAEGLKYEGGPVENEPRLVLVFLGEGWEGALALRHEFEATAEGLPGSGYEKILSQYSSIDGPISPGPLMGSPVVEKYYLKQAIAGGVERRVLTNAVTEVKQLAGGPERDPNTTYAVLPAPGTAEVEPDTCGYHVSLSPSEASLAAIMDTQERFGCGPPTMTFTHEYAESVTDPTQAGWRRSDEGNNEIADICNYLGPQRMADGERVAALWDDSKNACEVEDSDPGSVPIGPLTERICCETNRYGSTNQNLESETFETALYPCGLEAHYYFEYGTSRTYGSRTAEVVVPARWGEVPVDTTVTGLKYSTHYHWRLVVNTGNGTAYGGDHEFVIPYYVEIAGEEAEQIEAASAHLRAEIQPGGVEAKYHFEYGPTEAYGSSTPEASAGSGTSVEIVGEPLTGLMPGTLYHYRLVASSSRGTVVGKDNEFWTHGGRPAVETLAAGQVGPTEATLAGTVDPKGVATTFHFEYGTTEAYGSSTAEHAAAETDEAERAAIHDLAPGTTYHFRIVATNSYGTTYGADRTLATGIEPLVQTDAPTNVGSLGATLGGTVNPHGTAVAYYFEYGVAPGYGSRTAQTSVGPGEDDVQASQTIAGLSPGATYHYRLVAVYGVVKQYGGEVTFTTTALPPIVKPIGPAPEPAPAPTATPPPPAPPQTPSPPTVQNARQSAARWHESNRLARISRAKTPTGTTFSFSLNEQAAVSFSFTRLPGRPRAAHSCLARTHENIKSAICSTATAGTLSFTGHSGTNNVTFAGRMSHTRKLQPGQYELTITATSSTGQRSTPVSLIFTIVY